MTDSVQASPNDTSGASNAPDGWTTPGTSAHNSPVRPKTLGAPLPPIPATTKTWTMTCSAQVRLSHRASSCLAGWTMTETSAPYSPAHPKTPGVPLLYPLTLNLLTLNPL